MTRHFRHSPCGQAWVFCSALAIGCSKKEDAPTPPPAPVASASASSAPSAAPTPADPTPSPDPAKVAAAAPTPAEPNAPPPHDEHTQAAAAEIHKGNYKAELEALEKEDLGK
jgi:cell division septation protein DedD